MSTKIEVFGPGCAKCQTVYDAIRSLLDEYQSTAILEKISDPMQFALRGVLATPAIAIGGKIVMSGRAPSRDELAALLASHGISPAGTDSRPQSSCCCRSAPATPPATPVAPESASCCQSPSSAPAETSCCGQGSSCCQSSSSTGKAIFRRVLVWTLAITVIFAIIKIVNNKYNANDKSPAKAHTPIPIQTGSPAIAATPDIEVVYYMVGAKCPTCTRMRGWISQLMEQEFSKPVPGCKISHTCQDATQDDMEKYSMVTKTVVIKTLRGGKETSFIVLDRLFDHKSDEAAFKNYIASGIREAIAKAGEPSRS